MVAKVYSSLPAFTFPSEAEYLCLNFGSCYLSCYFLLYLYVHIIPLYGFYLTDREEQGVPESWADGRTGCKKN